jgi:hypothetical protein
MRKGFIKKNLYFEKITGVEGATRKFLKSVAVHSYGLD